jgi:glycosyltransferase involved in cell wall biosynthesis
VLQELTRTHDNVTALDLSRNFGQHVAVSAGLDFADADYVVLIDSDLQEPPRAIPKILRRLREEDLDIVYACRRSRSDPLLKKASSWLFWRLIRLLAGPQVSAHQMMLRGMRQRFVQAFRSLREQQRFIAGLTAWLGFRQAIIEVDGGQGVRGHSNYSLRRLLTLSLDATTSLSVVPLRFATGLGFAVTAAAGVYGLLILVRKIFFIDYAAGFPTLVLLVTGFSGIQLTILGILGEYLGRVLRQSQNRPLYFVRDIQGRDAGRLARTLPLPPTSAVSGEPSSC